MVKSSLASRLLQLPALQGPAPRLTIPSIASKLSIRTVVWLCLCYNNFWMRTTSVDENLIKHLEMLSVIQHDIKTWPRTIRNYPQVPVLYEGLNVTHFEYCTLGLRPPAAEHALVAPFATRRCWIHSTRHPRTWKLFNFKTWQVIVSSKMKIKWSRIKWYIIKWYNLTVAVQHVQEFVALESAA